MFNASMNFNLGEEIEAIRDTVRRFASGLPAGGRD